MGSRLVFSPKAHRYTLDGQYVPGVTTVINLATDKPGLVWKSAELAATWCADHVDELDRIGRANWIEAGRRYHRNLWDSKADRGTFLHDAARQLVAGVPLTPESGGVPWPDDVVESAKQLARFMDRWDVDPLYTERPVFNDVDWWAGTTDLVATVRGGTRWLFDYKTGDTGIYPKDAVQLAAYRHATHMQVEMADAEPTDIPMPEVDRTACVWIQPDRYEVIPVRTDDVVYEVFQSMVPVAAWAKWRSGESVGGATPAPKVAK